MATTNNIAPKLYTIEPIPLVYSSWTPNTENDELIQKAKITSNWKYRQYLQNNASHIINNNAYQTMQSTGINPYSIVNSTPIETSPKMFNSLYDNNYHTLDIFSKQSDLKQSFLNKQQMIGKMISPTVSFT